MTNTNTPHSALTAEDIRAVSPALRRLGNAVRPIHVTIQFSA